MARVTAAASLLSAIAIAGCGGSGTSRPDGKALFSQACSACHSLTGVESAKRQGGDLRTAHFSPAVMLQFAREMPVRWRLSPEELRSVADYVVSVERASH
jgi:mono/diheme cytochrome c family protein